MTDHPHPGPPEPATQGPTAQATPPRVVESDYAEAESFRSEDLQLASRPRRPLITRVTVALAATLIGAGCFLAGVQVEKGDVTSSTSTGGNRLAALAARFGTNGGTGTGASGFSSRFGSGAGGFGGGIRGTVATVTTTSLVITETNGNSVRVDLSPSTVLTKSMPVSRHQIFPGDTVSVTSRTGAKGTLSATALSDLGTGAAAGSVGGAVSSGGAGSGAASGSGSPTLNSLFGG